MIQIINLKDFLLSKVDGFGTYALVSYNGKIEATWFMRYYFEKSDWFLESPCELYKICKIKEPIDNFCKNYVNGLLSEGADEDKYIEKFVKPMIIDNWLYSIENFQMAPYLPTEVDNIELISERQCLKWLLHNRK